VDAADPARLPGAQRPRLDAELRVLRLDHRRPSRRTHAISAASYPLWLWLGYRHARR